MWLINTKTLEMEHKVREDEHRCAVLSHTWGEDEISHQEVLNALKAAKLKAAYAKILYTCEQACKDGLDYAWVDTCCIDRFSSAELFEAINSMYRWYQKAAVRYVQMADVSPSGGSATNLALGKYADAGLITLQRFRSSRWFTRGWTLQN